MRNSETNMLRIQPNELQKVVEKATPPQIVFLSAFEFEVDYSNDIPMKQRNKLSGCEVDL